MPTTLTIHGLDAPTAKALVMYAKRQTTSLNQAVKEILAASLGVAPAKHRIKTDNGLSKFCGCVPKDAADELLSFVENADFSKVDNEDL